jgi:hypothetical protein
VKQYKTVVQFLTISALTITVAGCGAPFNFGGSMNTIVGSGNVKSESRNVSGFSAVTVSGSGTLTVTVTGVESLTIEAEDNLLPVLTSDVSGNRLTLGVKDNTGIRPTREIKYTLTVKDLNDVQVSGSANVNASGLNTDKFSTVVSGSGNIISAGKANALDLRMSGSGMFNGEGMDAKTAIIDSSGSSNIVLRVSDKLDITVAGSGNVHYIGDPVVSQKISGSGSVSKQRS